MLLPGCRDGSPVTPTSTNVSSVLAMAAAVEPKQIQTSAEQARIIRNYLAHLAKGRTDSNFAFGAVNSRNQKLSFEAATTQLQASLTQANSISDSAAGLLFSRTMTDVSVKRRIGAPQLVLKGVDDVFHPAGMNGLLTVDRGSSSGSGYAETSASSATSVNVGLYTAVNAGWACSPFSTTGSGGTTYANISQTVFLSSGCQGAPIFSVDGGGSHSATIGGQSVTASTSSRA